MSGCLDCASQNYKRANTFVEFSMQFRSFGMWWNANNLGLGGAVFEG